MKLRNTYIAQHENTRGNGCGEGAGLHAVRNFNHRPHHDGQGNGQHDHGQHGAAKQRLYQKHMDQHTQQGRSRKDGHHRNGQQQTGDGHQQIDSAPDHDGNPPWEEGGYQPQQDAWNQGQHHRGDSHR